MRETQIGFTCSASSSEEGSACFSAQCWLVRLVLLNCWRRRAEYSVPDITRSLSLLRSLRRRSVSAMLILMRSSSSSCQAGLRPATVATAAAAAFFFFLEGLSPAVFSAAIPKRGRVCVRGVCHVFSEGGGGDYRKREGTKKGKSRHVTCGRTNDLACNLKSSYHPPHASPSCRRGTAARRHPPRRKMLLA